MPKGWEDDLENDVKCNCIGLIISKQKTSSEILTDELIKLIKENLNVYESIIEKRIEEQTEIIKYSYLMKVRTASTIKAA